MTRPRPAAVTADRNAREVIIVWQDGHTSRLPFAGLRAVCPCVECRGGHEHMGGLPDPQVVRDTPRGDLNLENVIQLGGYALQFFWSDGHSTGIYTWEALRVACPCPDCLST
ncbi:MAG: DUF971 domain-containing protein [Candidatus Promineifilaceae bacterium]|nr:DUF971 domain-containing protein [Candidatus Promineifilaceae bacterium]